MFTFAGTVNAFRFHSFHSSAGPLLRGPAQIYFAEHLTGYTTAYIE
jgi:hypothetical protein